MLPIVTNIMWIESFMYMYLIDKHTYTIYLMKYNISFKVLECFHAQNTFPLYPCVLLQGICSLVVV